MNEQTFNLFRDVKIATQKLPPDPSEPWLVRRERSLGILAHVIANSHPTEWWGWVTIAQNGERLPEEAALRTWLLYHGWIIQRGHHGPQRHYYRWNPDKWAPTTALQQKSPGAP